jgi:hypothetical protein
MAPMVVGDWLRSVRRGCHGRDLDTAQPGGAVRDARWPGADRYRRGRRPRPAPVHTAPSLTPTPGEASASVARAICLLHNRRSDHGAKGRDSPAVLPPPHTWRSVAVGLRLFCPIAGLFLAAGFKEAYFPKAVAIGGIAILVVGGVDSAIASRRRASSGD